MKVLVLNGPNLNMLGKRDPKQYGTVTLNDIYEMMKNEGSDMDFEFLQSNHEGDLIDRIHKLDYDAIIINAGGLTHYSISLRDALDIFKGEKVEVHLSNIYERESFRSNNVIKDVVTHSIVGLKEFGYIEAIKYLRGKINNNN